MTDLLECASRTATRKLIHTARTRAANGRRSVRRLPGSSRLGAKPEQLFAAGWSACLESSIVQAANRRKITLPAISIDAEVALHLVKGEYFLSADFNVSLPGLNRDVAESLVEEAEYFCSYSKATRGKIDVAFNVV
jgi:osmotically inducible protein OsmC